MDERGVIEGVAVHGGVAEDGHEVVGVGARPAVLDHRVDVVGVFDERDRRLLHEGGVGGAERLEHVVGPAQQVVSVAGRDAQHVADHDDGQRRRDVLDEVAVAPLADGVDDGVAGQSHPVLHGPHPLGSEPLGDEPAAPHVLGRVEVDHHGQGGELGPDPLRAGKGLGVDRDLFDGRVAGRGPQVVGLVVVERGVGPHPGVGVVGLPAVEGAAE